MNIILKTYKIKSVLSVRAQIVLKFVGCLVKEKNKYKSSACFFENTHSLLILKIVPKTALEFLFRLS
jgi:hypothetical protein